MRKFFRDRLPDYDTVRNSPWLRPFGRWLHHPNLWHLNRRSVSGGVAVGMFCGLIPGPFQMLGAALFAVALRVNLPVALFTTLYTNPFTILPLYLLAYEYGALVLGREGELNRDHLDLPALHWNDWPDVLLDWLVRLGPAFAVGLPLLALTLALLGYVLVRGLWVWRVRRAWLARRRK